MLKRFIHNIIILGKIEKCQYDSLEKELVKRLINTGFLLFEAASDRNCAETGWFKREEIVVEWDICNWVMMSRNQGCVEYIWHLNMCLVFPIHHETGNISVVYVPGFSISS